jgi:ankyrin repeat protein
MPTAEKSAESQSSAQQKPTVNSSMLIDYVRKGSLEEVKAAVGMGADVNKRDANWGYTPVMFAARSGSLPMVKILVEEGADIHANDSHKDTVLAKAAMAGSTEIVELLLGRIKTEADRYNFVNLPDEMGFTPLMCAAMNGRTDTVKVLMRGGAEVNITNANGDTAAHLAATWGHMETMHALFEGGADITMPNGNGLDIPRVAEANGFKYWLPE